MPSPVEPRRKPCRSLLRDRGGTSGIEFAFALPILLIIAVGLVEVGRAINQTTTVQKALRSGALYAARHQFPLDSQTETEIENLVKYGDAAGGAHYLLPGWASAQASFQMDLLSFNIDGVPFGGTVIPVVRLTARVPFQPILGSLLPIASFDITASHDQAFIGD